MKNTIVHDEGTASLEAVATKVKASGTQIKFGLDRAPVIQLHASAQQIEIPEIYGIIGNGSGQFDLNLKGLETKLSGVFQFTRADMNLGEFESDLDRNIQVVGDEGDKPDGSESFHGVCRVSGSVHWRAGSWPGADSYGRVAARRSSLEIVIIQCESTTWRITWPFCRHLRSGTFANGNI